MNSSISTPAKTNTLDTNAVNTAQRVTPAQIGRILLHKWDLLAVVGLLASSAAYSVCAITQMTGF